MDPTFFINNPIICELGPQKVAALPWVCHYYFCKRCVDTYGRNPMDAVSKHAGIGDLCQARDVWYALLQASKNGRQSAR